MEESFQNDNCWYSERYGDTHNEGEVHLLENENSELKENIEELLQDHQIKSSEDGQYSNSV